jgi:hypothetical protein
VEMMEKQNINRRVFCIGLRVSSDSVMQVVFTKQIRWIAYMSGHVIDVMAVIQSGEDVQANREEVQTGSRDSSSD